MAKSSYTRRVGIRVGRNDLCPCGSGKKYKKCCMDDEGIVAEDILNDEDDVSLKELANPNCDKCFGTGRLGFKYVSDDEKIAILCDKGGCALDNYLERKLKQRREEAKKRAAEGKKSEKVEKSSDEDEDEGNE